MIKRVRHVLCNICPGRRSDSGAAYNWGLNSTASVSLQLFFFTLAFTQEVDEKCGPTFHCVCGPHFGSFVSHEAKYMAYFAIGHMTVLLWKHG
jgi:hypothetical protein